MSTSAILADADQALSVAADESAERSVRVAALTRLMTGFDALAREVAAGTASWDEARPWAERNAERFYESRDILDDWQSELGSFMFGNEEDFERALMRRSQHAFARALFRDTVADELLSRYETEEVDNDFRERAELIQLRAPAYAPTTHTWWWWPTPEQLGHSS